VKISEFAIQSACVEYINMQQDERFKLIFAVPNGMKSSARAAIRAKKEGLRAGVSDLIVLCPSHDKKYHSAALEFKTSTGKLSKSQKEFLMLSEKHGSLSAIIRDVKQFVDLINEYFGIEEEERAAKETQNSP